MPRLTKPLALRSGHTVWRCLVAITYGKVVVSVYPVRLKGKRYWTPKVVNKVMPTEPILFIGDDSCNDTIGGYSPDRKTSGRVVAFGSQRQAIKFKHCLESGQPHAYAKTAIEAAQEFEESWNRLMGSGLFNKSPPKSDRLSVFRTVPMFAIRPINPIIKISTP